MERIEIVGIEQTQFLFDEKSRFGHGHSGQGHFSNLGNIRAAIGVENQFRGQIGPSRHGQLDGVPGTQDGRCTARSLAQDKQGIQQ